MNFIFCDTEATGPDPLHDQLLWIAAVLTGADLKVRDSFSLRCRLRPHQLPSAEALLLTGLSIGAITDPSLPSHHAMISAMRDRFLDWGPAVFTGYSSLEFDQPLLARSLERSLLSAEFAGASRLDVQRLALGLHAFFPDAIAFATRFDGKPSFRLADVARANGLAQGRAHDAMGDVSTTLAISRLVRERAPWLWSHMLRMGRPEEAARFAAEEPVRLYTEFHHNRPHHWLVTALGRAVPEGDMIGFDLAHDPEEGRGLDHASLLAWLRRHPRPLRAIRIGDCPFILPRETAAGRVEDIDADGRARLLAQDPTYRDRLLKAYVEIAPREAMAPQENPELRLRYEEKPDGLDAGTRARIEDEIAEKMMADGSAPWMTLNRAFDEADAAFEGASDAQAAEIEALLAYLRRELAWAEERLASQNRSKPKR